MPTRKPGQRPAFSSTRQTLPDLGIVVRSRWERNYAYYLAWLKRTGQIAEWRYEPRTYYFDAQPERGLRMIRHGTVAYRPDFEVVEKNGTTRLVEVKGYLTDQARVALKRMRTYYPHERIILVQDPFFRAVCGKRHCRLIPGWHCPHTHPEDYKKRKETPHGKTSNPQTRGTDPHVPAPQCDPARHL